MYPYENKDNFITSAINTDPLAHQGVCPEQTPYQHINNSFISPRIMPSGSIAIHEPLQNCRPFYPSLCQKMHEHENEILVHKK
ncbi:hypothetical protein MXB_1023, partial [Myxobolus squamalis]